MFLLLTIDTIRRVPAQTKQQNLTEQVVHGKHLWERNNCMGCHTLLGEGAYYAPELSEVFQHAYHHQLALMLKGPTGCGKTRFVEAMAVDVGCPLCTVACHDDTSATDLLGRYLVEGGDTVWQDGPLTRAVREGAILYLDEVTEAREDIVVVLHSLTDHRRQTPSHLVHSLAQLYARLWY